MPMDRLVAVSRTSKPRSVSSGRKRYDTASSTSTRTKTGTAYTIALTISGPLLRDGDRLDAAVQQPPGLCRGVRAAAGVDEPRQPLVAGHVEQLRGPLLRGHRRDRKRVSDQAVERKQVRD